MLLLTAMGMVGSYLSVYFARCSQRTIDAASSGLIGEFKTACLIQGAVVLASLVLSLVSSVMRDVLACRMDRDWKMEMIHTLLYSDFKGISTHHSGELVNRMSSDAAVVNRAILTLIPGLISTVTRLVVATYALVSMEPYLAIMVGVMGLITFVAVGIFRIKMKEFYKLVREMNGKLAAFFQDILSKLLIVQALDVGDEIERRTDDLLEVRWNLQKKRRHIKILTSTSFSLFTRAVSFVTLIWCVVRVFRGEITFGTMTATLQLFSQMRSPTMSFSSIVPMYTSLMISTERLMEIEALKNDDIHPVDREAVYERMTALCCEDVAFSYAEDKPPIRYSSFRLPKGSVTAVTGASGIGKSTLLKLLLGIYSTDAGRFYAETPEGAVELTRETRGLFAYVPQGNLLFNDTLRNNLLLTAPQATDEEIRRALYISDLEELVKELPDGLETMLGENSLGLSEGQAQRVSIARAVLSGAPILLLDEATSALDAATEATVLERIVALKDRTCIIVTHRMAALDVADWEITMHDGGLTCRRAANH